MLICFEDIFPGLARESVQEGANLLINITNDGWFKESHQQVQHAANAVFRAVENRVPLVRCCNNGFTCIVEPTGQISAWLEDPQQGIYMRGLKTAEVKLDDHPPTFYARFGDVFAFLCLVITGLFWTSYGWRFLTPRKSKTLSEQSESNGADNALRNS